MVETLNRYGVMYYRGFLRIGDTGPLECAGRAQRRRRFGGPEPHGERAIAGSRFACPRTPKRRAPRPNVVHPTVSSVNRFECPSSRFATGEFARFNREMQSWNRSPSCWGVFGHWANPQNPNIEI